MKDSNRPRITRDDILDATDKLLARSGYKKMTIDDLAAEVGIGKGSVYLHFKSKEEIALSHIDRIIERLKARLERIAKRDGRIEDRLRDMLIERVLFRFDSVQHYTRSINELFEGVRPALLERRKRYFEEEARLFAAAIAEGIAAGALEEIDPLDAARTVVLATNALLPFSLSTQELGKRSEIRSRAGALADLLIRGLKKSELGVKK